MAINVNLAPFINEEFLVTGAWGEPRSGHIHAGIDLQTRKAYQTGIGQPVYSMSRGEVIRVDQTDQTGYGGLCIIRDLDDNYMWLYGEGIIRWISCLLPTTIILERIPGKT